MNKLLPFLLGLIFLAYPATTAQAQEPPVTFYVNNRCNVPLDLYVKASSRARWPRPIKIRPGESRAVRLVSDDTFDVLIRYYLTPYVYRDLRFENADLKSLARNSGEYTGTLEESGFYGYTGRQWIRLASKKVPKTVDLSSNGYELDLEFTNETNTSSYDPPMPPIIVPPGF